MIFGGQHGRVTLSTELYFCCSLVWIFFVCASVFVEGIASEWGSDQRKSLTQGDRSTVGGLHLIGHLIAAVTLDLIFYAKVGSVFCNDIKYILVAGSFSDDFRDFEPKCLLLITK